MNYADFVSKMMAWPNPVPEVDASYLQKLFNMLKTFPYGMKSCELSLSAVERVCGPCDDFAAVWQRYTTFGILKRIREMQGLTVPGMLDGQPTEALFKSLAVLPITPQSLGDPSELFRGIEQQCKP